MKDITTLIFNTHITLKVAITNLLLLFPFFFVSIYLFHTELVEKINTPHFGNIHFWYLIFLCLCLSLLWFYV